VNGRGASEAIAFHHRYRRSPSHCAPQPNEPCQLTPPTLAPSQPRHLANPFLAPSTPRALRVLSGWTLSHDRFVLGPAQHESAGADADGAVGAGPSRITCHGYSDIGPWLLLQRKGMPGSRWDGTDSDGPAQRLCACACIHCRGSKDCVRVTVCAIVHAGSR
jgi:hypothetical protein